MNKILIIISFLFCFIFDETQSQSLIAGIPSADVAKEKTWIFTHESQLNTWKYNKTKWNSFNFLCYGIASNTEFTVSFSNLSNSPISHESVGIGFKRLFPLRFIPLEESKFVFGQNVLFSVDKPSVGGWSYAMVSSRLPSIKSRLTIGISYGSAELFGYDTLTENLNGKSILTTKERNPFSFMAGFEQPIIEKKFSIIADWFSGRHDLSALITGLQFERHHFVIISGYKFMNFEAVDKGSIILEAMYEF